jgi:hypothetical protein
MPTPEAIAAAKEIHAESWHGKTYDEMIAVGAAAIDRHFSDYVEVKRERDAALRDKKAFRAGIAEAIIKLQETACF